MLVAVSLLAISLSVFLYHYPPSSWKARHQDDAASSVGLETKSQKSSPSPQKTRAMSPTGGEDENAAPEVSDISSQTTPKVSPIVAEDVVPIPTFTLAEHQEDDNEDDDEEDEEDNMPPPSFPALNSAQRASAPAAPSSTPLMAPPPPRMPSLMAPPQLKASNLRALPTQGGVQGLRIPTTGPLPNRGLIPNRTPNSGLGIPQTAGTLRTPNARGKVLLSPGHSPLDWANLQRSGKNLSGVDSLIRVTPTMLKHNNGRKGKPAWSSYQGRVYNITPYLPFHPGGEGELRRVAGKDGGKLFMEVHPWVNWENMLGECLVGIAVSEEHEQQYAAAQHGSSLEDMD